MTGLGHRFGPHHRTRLEANAVRPYVTPHPNDPNDVILDVAALQDAVGRRVVVAFDSKHVDAAYDFLPLGFYEKPLLEYAMLDALRLVETTDDTLDEVSDEESLREYAAEFGWFISPDSKGVDYSHFRDVCFFPPNLIWNQAVYLPMPEGPPA